MRLRNIPAARPAVKASPICIQDPVSLMGAWKSQPWNPGSDGASAPLHIEIGMGKGHFITEMARRNPDIAYLGIERYESVMYKALLRMGDEEPSNLRFLCEDAGNMPTFFKPGEIDRIYLNFSDPWPKARHDKRRLTHHRFLQIYADLLPVEGLIEFKTDNEALFDFSIEEIEAFPDFDLIKTTRDLHHDDDMNPGNVMTEYEAKFSALGNPIYKLIAKRR